MNNIVVFGNVAAFKLFKVMARIAMALQEEIFSQSSNSSNTGTASHIVARPCFEPDSFDSRMFLGALIESEISATTVGGQINES